MRLARVPMDLKRLASVHPLVWAIAAGVAASTWCGWMLPFAVAWERDAYWQLVKFTIWWSALLCSLATTGWALLSSVKDLAAHPKLFPSGSLLEYWGPLEIPLRRTLGAQCLDSALREDRRLRLASKVRSIAFWNYVAGVAVVVLVFGLIVSLALMTHIHAAFWLVPVTGLLVFTLAESRRLAAQEAMKRDAVGSEEFLPKMASNREPGDQVEYVS